MFPTHPKPSHFLLAVKALHIKYAAYLNPYTAVNTSPVQPLPHQLAAVYDEFLPRFPLRYLLADDPGAGKTIMAGLYIKELLLTDSCHRALIIAPGSLVDQWQDELLTKFGLHFDIIDPSTPNPFERPYLIARMDQLARSKKLLDDLKTRTFDLLIIDEAHRMSATYNSYLSAIKPNKRFALGALATQRAHNVLLMTATPHAGKEDDFQTFLTLLDPDRFAGAPDPSLVAADYHDLMRRMVKEKLVTTDGSPLFPPRHATTLTYTLDPDEHALYTAVTNYVRQEMGRAQKKLTDTRHKNQVGFALTILQRRLTSSPEAIYQSLNRRLTSLKSLHAQLKYNPHILLHRSTTDSDIFTDLAEPDTLDTLPTGATASTTLEELTAEINTLTQLVAQARVLRVKGTDRKWNELKNLIGTLPSLHYPHKLVIFTEHLDTLNYLAHRVRNNLGTHDAVITIDGSLTRHERRNAQHRFATDDTAQILIATDAAGEGINLQCAHLMVNYDLPWNPNRIEQRFGRIHRIGQTRECHLWNMLATDTIEGRVYQILLEKIDAQVKAYSGNIFNVLGEDNAGADGSLRDLLLSAIAESDSSAQIDDDQLASIAQRISTSLDENMAVYMRLPDNQAGGDAAVQMEKLRRSLRHRLTPQQIENFCVEGMRELVGSMVPRGAHVYGVQRIPSAVSAKAGELRPDLLLPESFSRIKFDPNLSTTSPAELVTLGHLLLDSLVGAVVDKYANDLVDPVLVIDDSEEQSPQPELVSMYHSGYQLGGFTAGSARTVQQVGYLATRCSDGETEQYEHRSVHPSFEQWRYPNPDERTFLDDAQGSLPKLSNLPLDGEDQIAETVMHRYVKPAFDAAEKHHHDNIDLISQKTTARIHREINELSMLRMSVQAAEGGESLGRVPTGLSKSDIADKIASLEDRLVTRLDELNSARACERQQIRLLWSAIVIPSQWLAANGYQEPEEEGIQHNEDPRTFASELDTRSETERRAVDLVLSTERKLGRVPQEMARNNEGFDIRSVDPATGDEIFIEVKGRVEGAETFTISRSEVAFAQAHKGSYRLALVAVSQESADADEVRYIPDAGNWLRIGPWSRSVNEDWREFWAHGGDPA